MKLHITITNTPSKTEALIKAKKHLQPGGYNGTGEYI